MDYEDAEKVVYRVLIVVSVLAGGMAIAYDLYQFARSGAWDATTLSDVADMVGIRLPLTDSWLGINAILGWFYDLGFSVVAGLVAVFWAILPTD